MKPRKLILAMMLALTSFNSWAQASNYPSDYYMPANGLSGEALKTALYKPTVFRLIGTIKLSDLDHISSKEEGLQIKSNKDNELNITIEGIGEDATIKDFGILAHAARSLELRNFAIMNFMDDAVSVDNDNKNVWIHHLDIFYGQPGSDSDQAKGDGTVDVKTNSQYITVSYNHFWDSGKSSLCGMKSESGPNYISYDHNWFDH